MQDRFALGIALFLLLLLPIAVGAQIQGIPFVKPYSKEAYGFGTQNWDIDQDSTAILYFANNDGLLQFDGATWMLFPLPNKTILRSIAKVTNGILAGGQNEFGIYLPDEAARWRFKSLKATIPEIHRSFDDVWDLEVVGETIFFRASKKVFILKGDKCTVIDRFPVTFVGRVGQRVFAQDEQGFLYEYLRGNFQVIASSEALAGTMVTEMLAWQGRLLIATEKNGLFSYNAGQILPWELLPADAQEINTMTILGNNDIAIGVAYKGLYVFNKEGQLKYRLQSQDGLPNNKIISSFLDQNHNLWLGHDLGISMIETNSPFSRIYPLGELDGAGYVVQIFDNQIYFGTGSGLYVAPLDSPSEVAYELVRNTAGQVWGLDVVDDRLLMSHNEGGFWVEGNTATHFLKREGNWLFLQDQQNPNLLLAGHYEGISVFDNATLNPLFDIPNFKESSRFLVQDSRGDYWVSHPYKGVYRIQNATRQGIQKIDRFGPVQGLPSYLHNHVFLINDQILVCAEQGVYSFDDSTERFEPYDPLNQFLGSDNKVRRLFETPNEDIWFITDNEIGVLEIDEKGLNRTIKKRVFPALKNKMNGGFERIYPYDEEHVFLTTINGFLHYDPRYTSDRQPIFHIVPEELVINEDSLIYLQPLQENLVLSHREQSLLFKMGVTEFVNNENVRFQFKLEGFDEDWTPPSRLRMKAYTNLAPKSYVLRVRAFNQDDIYATDYAFPFIILKPWYLSIPAVLTYLVLLLTSGYLVYTRLRKSYTDLEQKVDHTVKLSNEEIQRLETEKVQAELDHKKRELVSATMHLIKKNETIADIANELAGIRNKTREATTTEQLGKLIRFLKKEELEDNNWEQLMFHFNEIHEGFFEELKQKYPALTPKDLRLCAYLKMNLTTKEMASLMSVSLRGVEASRYRLRKKLGLGSEVNLTSFFMGI
ncbi:MAG: triple tyrosine motif-containing protein [Bacteroidota bacterium]